MLLRGKMLILKLSYYMYHNVAHDICLKRCNKTKSLIIKGWPPESNVMIQIFNNSEASDNSLSLPLSLSSLSGMLKKWQHIWKKDPMSWKKGHGVKLFLGRQTFLGKCMKGGSSFYWGGLMIRSCQGGVSQMYFPVMWAQQIGKFSPTMVRY